MLGIGRSVHADPIALIQAVTAGAFAVPADALRSTSNSASTAVLAIGGEIGDTGTAAFGFPLGAVFRATAP